MTIIITAPAIAVHARHRREKENQDQSSGWSDAAFVQAGKAAQAERKWIADLTVEEQRDRRSSISLLNSATIAMIIIALIFGAVIAYGVHLTAINQSL